jgi:hypothetical protein
MDGYQSIIFLGGWALIPRGPHHSIGRTLTREWALVISARFVSLARGEQDYYSPEGLVTATEGVKSNALMRCCKDIGKYSNKSMILLCMLGSRRYRQRIMGPCFHSQMEKRECFGSLGNGY